MSLIEEALRKQQEESDKTKGEGLRLSAPAVPPAPPPVPPPPEAPAGDSEAAPRRALPMLLAVVGGVVVLVGLIVWLLFFGLNIWTTPVAKTEPAPKPAVAKRVEEKATAPAAVATPPVTSKVQVVQAPPAAVSTSAAPVAAEQPVTATTSAPVVSAVATAVVAVLPQAAVEPVKPVEKITVVAWPKLTVTGIIGTAQGTKSAAIINRQVVEAGGTIEGVRVESIDRKGVRLSYEGETKTLPVGGTTE